MFQRGRKTRAQEGDVTDRWASIVSEGREWAAGLLAQEERRGVHWAEEMGRERERETGHGEARREWG